MFFFKSLTMLDLSYNRLLRLEDSSFTALPRLVSLDLSHNIDLTFEPRGRSFQGLEDTLQSLGLKNVSLSTVTDFRFIQKISFTVSCLVIIVMYN